MFPARLFLHPQTVVVYGPSAPLVNLSLFALALNTNPEFHWVEIGQRSEDRTPCDPVRLGWIPDERLWRVDDPRVLRPNDEHAHFGISALISPEESPETVRRFTEFLRLPDLSQQILASYAPDGRPGVVAVTNAEDARETFSGDRVPPILGLHRDTGFSVMVGCGPSAGPGRMVFDFVFRIQGDGGAPATWREHELVCEKGVVSGPLSGLHPVRLRDIPLLADVLSRAVPRS